MAGTDDGNPAQSLTWSSPYHGTAMQAGPNRFVAICRLLQCACVVRHLLLILLLVLGASFFIPLTFADLVKPL